MRGLAQLSPVEPRPVTVNEVYPDDGSPTLDHITDSIFVHSLPPSVTHTVLPQPAACQREPRVSGDVKVPFQGDSPNELYLARLPAHFVSSFPHLTFLNTFRAPRHPADRVPTGSATARSEYRRLPPPPARCRGRDPPMPSHAIVSSHSYATARHPCQCPPEAWLVYEVLTLVN